MFERFTQDARAVVIFTQDLCHRLGADEVRPVHLLPALTHEGSGVRDVLAAHDITTDAVTACLGVVSPAQPPPLGEDDAAALGSLGINLDAIREAVERQFGEGALDEPTKDVPQGAGPAAPPAGDGDSGAWAPVNGLGGAVTSASVAARRRRSSSRCARRCAPAPERSALSTSPSLCWEPTTRRSRCCCGPSAQTRAVRTDLEDRGRRTA